jgi:hypothetical protein
MSRRKVTDLPLYPCRQYSRQAIATINAAIRNQPVTPPVGDVIAALDLKPERAAGEPFPHIGWKELRDAQVKGRKKKWAHDTCRGRK